MEAQLEAKQEENAIEIDRSLLSDINEVFIVTMHFELVSFVFVF